MSLFDKIKSWFGNTPVLAEKEPEWDEVDPKNTLTPREYAMVAMFESIIAEEPDAYQRLDEIVYQVTMKEVIRFAKIQRETGVQLYRLKQSNQLTDPTHYVI